VFDIIGLIWRRRPDRSKRYELLEEIARGGMSTVWKARRRESGQVLAVKVLKPGSAALMRLYRKRFRTHEGRIALELDHPNVIRTYDYGRWERKTYYIAMEFIDGPNLERLIRLQEPGVRQARLGIVMQVARGLSYIHKMGLIHRDFCPKNVLYSAEGVAKIIDFGLTIPAKARRRAGGHRAGTASYMAPEQIRRLAVDERTDIYAFGVSAFEILTGRQPFPEAHSKRGRMELRLNLEPASLAEVDPTLPAQMDAILHKCIEKQPHLRYKSMDEVIEALEGVPGGQADGAGQ